MKGEIYEALSKVMAEVGAVGKERKNQVQGYQFRGIDDVMAAVQGVLSRHGVVCVPRVREREREVVTTAKGGTMASVRLLVDHHFVAKDGSEVVCTTLGEAMDSGDKASNKAMSAALKYALTFTLCIPTYEADADTEEQSPQMAGKTKPAAKPKVEQPAGDAVEREEQALVAAFAAAQSVPQLDALWARVKALPTDVVARLTGAFRARKSELNKVAA